MTTRITELDKRRIQDKEEILKQVADTALEMRAMLTEFKVITIVSSRSHLHLAQQPILTVFDDDLPMQLKQSNLLLRPG